MIESVIAFINEIESHCYSQAIATFLPSNDQPFVIDLVRKGQKVKYGYKSGMREKFIKKLISECQPIGTLVLRSFTAEIDEMTKLPIKELRGYIIDSDGENWQYQKISSTEMFAAQNTDYRTGEPLPLEQSVRYC
jgi:hypothetical protein